MRAESKKDAKKLTRRAFARTAAIAAATAAMAPGIDAGARLGTRTGLAGDSNGNRGEDAASARQAEIDARVADIFRRYGDRISAEQKTEVRRLAGELQKGLDKLRAYPLGNGDQPATVLRLVPDAAEVSRAPRR